MTGEFFNNSNSVIILIVLYMCLTVSLNMFGWKIMERNVKKILGPKMF